MDQSAYFTFIRHVITNKNLMWETLPSNADWDSLKTLTLREILRIRIPHQVEHCVFSEALETNFSFAQFNRSRNHFVGCRIKDGWYTRTRFLGFDRHSSSREHASE